MAFNDSNVLAVNSDGRLFHAIRHNNGSWTQFGDVENQAQDRGTLTQVAAAQGQDNTRLHVLAVNSDGRLWHTVRPSNGQWTAFSDVEAQTGDMGKVASVAATVAFGSEHLHVLAINTDGRLWHTIRFSSGAWLPIGDVEGQTGEMGNLVHVATASADNSSELHVVAVNSDGRLWHTIRTDSPSPPPPTWTPVGDVEGQAGEMGVLRRTAAAIDGTRLHVVSVNSDGRLWHTVRSPFPTPTWTKFGDVEGQAGDRGTIVDVAAADMDSGGVLQVLAVNSEGRLWHTVRQSFNGPWTPFGDVEPQTTEIGTIKTAAITR